MSDQHPAHASSSAPYEIRRTFSQAEDLYRSLFENSHSIMLILDPTTGGIVDANDTACRFYGYRREELLRMTIAQINTLSAQQVQEEMRMARREERQFFSFKHLCKDGTVRDVEVYSGPITIDGATYLYSIVHDISDRKAMEGALQASEKLLSDVFDSIQDGISVISPDLTVQRVNRKMNQWYGANVPLEGKKCFACYHNAERPCHPCPSLRCMQSGRPENEIVPGLPGSPVQWVELHAYPVVDQKSGAISGVVEFVRDITERVASQKALAESEEKYRLLVENATEAIFIAQDGYLKFVNPKTLQLIGHEGADVSQIPFVEFIHPDDRSMVAEMHRRRLAGDDHLPSAYTFRIMNKNGDKHPVELNTVKIDWDGRPATLNFVRDLSTQKRLEAELQQAQKMEAIGTLAGGIAHDFNNLLMGIMGRSSLMLTTLQPTDPHYEHVKGIEACVKSATDLTGQLLGFARGGKYEVTPANMNDIVEQTACMFWRTKKEISIRTKYEPNLWTVEVDRRQMEQVLLNLFVNAWQAMSGGGELHLQTENLIVDAAHFRHQQVRPGPCVCISFTDTGVGMDEQTRRRIFEPFFTTKEMGRGTGLGLASAYGIIKNHAGAIKVYSEKGHGTTFAIYLPASENKVPVQKPRPQAILSGSETVLLVDDEQLVIDVGQQMLAHLGYKVLVARSGAEAVRVYAQQKSNIDLVILDLIMPGGGGGETFDRLLAIDTHVKVLLSSGYSINGQAQDVLQRGCKGFIQKPFGLDQLSTTIRKILSED